MSAGLKVVLLGKCFLISTLLSLILTVTHLLLYPFNKYLYAPIMYPTLRTHRWTHVIPGF